jgi:hypothetical protein
MDITDIVVADPVHCSVDELRKDSSAKNCLRLINQGKCDIFSTETDRGFWTGDIQLRIVDSLEPILTNEEFKYVTWCSDSTIICIPTGIIAVTDIFFLDNEEDRISTSITPGNYKVCVYLLSNEIEESESFYIVLCKTANETNK